MPIIVRLLEPLARGGRKEIDDGRALTSPPRSASIAGQTPIDRGE